MATPLLILDLNGNLLLSQHSPVPNCPSDARANVKYLYFRPHLHNFLHFAFTHFRVAIWTSNAPHNAEATVRAILSPAQREQLEFLWSRTHCKLGANYSSIKELQKVFNERGEDPRRVTILDDTPAKIGGVCEPNNYLKVLSYDKPNAADEELLKIKHLLTTMYNLQTTTENARS